MYSVNLREEQRINKGEGFWERKENNFLLHRLPENQTFPLVAPRAASPTDRTPRTGQSIAGRWQAVLNSTKTNEEPRIPIDRMVFNE